MEYRCSCLVLLPTEVVLTTARDGEGSSTGKQSELVELEVT